MYDNLVSFYLYVGYILLDGDYANDWLSHLPDDMQVNVSIVGYILSVVLGY